MQKETNKKYLVSSIEETWQGEGVLTGTPVLLIRFYGCNLDCVWCDEKSDATPNEIDLISYIESYQGKRAIMLTGGEPLRQIDTALGKTLSAYADFSAYPIFLETNGTLHFPEGVYINWLVTISPKAGQSWTLCSDQTLISYCLKFVVPGGWKSPKHLVDEVKEKVPVYHLSKGPIVLQPEYGKQEDFFTWVRETERHLGHPVFISTQNHKQWAKMPGWELKDGRI